MAAPATAAEMTETKTDSRSDSGIVIRPFNPSPDSWDEVAVSRICEITAPPDLRAVLTPPPSTPLAPYLWALPYVRLEPGTCFVLDASAAAGADGDADVTFQGAGCEDDREVGGGVEGTGGEGCAFGYGGGE
ncbi:hypothetical protein V493_02914 [Pseudogymnoascus sp. VKM F-4281 (FW-2241)]|nr:hypothetical protein V493_02914 [Pseudogymnoascus sp. VKM F-4281 (FW-2241)]